VDGSGAVSVGAVNQQSARRQPITQIVSTITCRWCISFHSSAKWIFLSSAPARHHPRVSSRCCVRSGGEERVVMVSVVCWLVVWLMLGARGGWSKQASKQHAAMQTHRVTAAAVQTNTPLTRHHQGSHPSLPPTHPHPAAAPQAAHQHGDV